jgi:predicted HNH restriction endonuclease
VPTYSESDLIVPAAVIIAAHSGGIGTTELSRQLRSQLRPSGDDLTILANRNDDKFSQKVRNLKSHETLEKRGLATFSFGWYYITAPGRILASENGEAHQALIAQGFSETQRHAALDRNYDGIVIEEGDRTIANRSVVRRSSLLKKIAMKHFVDRDGSVACAGCGFRAEKAYGPDAIGQLIEIHHTEPLYLAQTNIKSSIDAALRKVAPLCPNCHRMVHRIPSECMSITELKDAITRSRQAVSRPELIAKQIS